MSVFSKYSKFRVREITFFYSDISKLPLRSLYTRLSISFFRPLLIIYILEIPGHSNL